jgi:glycosyltransferase involved in cell wall biosynthesis
MRVLHLLSSPAWSGPAEPLALLAQAQRSLGHEVTVAIDRTRAGTGSEEAAAPQLRALGLLDGGDLRLCTRDGPWATWSDIRKLAHRAIDVLHAHFTHDHWVARLGRPRRAVLVRSLHAPRSARRLLPAADAFTVPMPELAQRLRRPWRLLPPLVSSEFAPPADRRALQTSLGLTPPVVGMVSTFQPTRRHEVALEAFARLGVPTATLVLLGDGVLGPALQAQARGRGLADRVRFPGYQSGPALVRWMQSFDQLWILGLGNDWAGRGAVQGRAVGARVVGVDEGALPGWVDTLLPSATPVALATAALSRERREIQLPDARAVAQEILGLYADAGAVL